MILVDISALPINTEEELNRVDAEYHRLSSIDNRDFSICINDEYYPSHQRHMQSWF